MVHYCICHQCFASSTERLIDVGIAFLLMAAFSFLPSGLIPYIIVERKQKEKRVQLVSGVSPLLYWTTTFIWDVLIIALFVSITAAILVAFGIPSFTAGQNLEAVLLLLFFFCTAAVTGGYCIEKWFTEPSIGQLIIICLNILLGVFSMMIVLILDTMSNIQVLCNRHG